jgi:flagellin
MTALQTLNQTNKELLTTQNRISTGLRVASASDNASYWSIATTMRSDKQSLSTVSDALGLGSATADIAAKGIESAITVAGQLKDKLLAARQPGVDRTKIQSEITQLQSSLSEIVNGASFNGQNWLTGDSTDTDAMTRTLVASFSRDSSGAISVGTISVDLTKTLLVDTAAAAADKTGALDTQHTTTNGGTDYTVLDLDISALTDSPDDLGDLEEMLTTVDTALTSMTDAASSLGAVKTRIDIQKDFSASLMDAIDKGVSQLVDADMNEESTRLQALQVRQQLGIQALSIANQSAQSILSLFR